MNTLIASQFDSKEVIIKGLTNIGKTSHTEEENLDLMKNAMVNSFNHVLDSRKTTSEVHLKELDELN